MNERLKEFVSEYFDTFYDKNDLKFAQAVADFTEKRVLEEMRLLLMPLNQHSQAYLVGLIDQRLAKLKGEKDGKD